MANIFLTSSLQTVAKDLAKHINKDVKKFLFITTASEVEEAVGEESAKPKSEPEWLRFDREAMINLGYDAEDYTVTGKTNEEVSNKLAEVDGIIMAGGNTFYLLEKVYESGFDKAIKTLLQ